MMSILRLTFKSISNRKFTAALTIIAIAFSVTLLLGVEKVRREARASFANTISGTDLIVGARSGSVQLLLYSVFRIGNATNNISWESYQEIAGHPRVKWTVPISLGDSHRGFRIMGTNGDYFRFYRFGPDRSIEFSEGRAFNSIFEAVMGHDVAEELGYGLGEKIVIAHGASDISLVHHEDKPFTIVGILKKTGTPLDRTVHVSLEGIEAIHIDWKRGAPMPGFSVSAEEAAQMDLDPQVITAFLVGLHSKISTFRVQRMINEYGQEPLLAIMPGIALQELWGLMGVAEKALVTISAFVVLTGLVGMLTVILTNLNERRREMAILRSVGARPLYIFTLLVSEAGGFAAAGSLIGVIIFYVLQVIARPLVESRFGLYISIGPPTPYDLAIVATVIIAGFLMGIVPAYRAYRYSLADGMTIRI
jgi:putative ABC transport system permease protein